MSSFVVSFDGGRIICHPAIKNDSGAILWNRYDSRPNGSTSLSF
jgi:hypothetical protein